MAMKEFRFRAQAVSRTFVLRRAWGAERAPCSGLWGAGITRSLVQFCPSVLTTSPGSGSSTVAVAA
eukprot:2543893-Rhodomonas_salina.4